MTINARSLCLLFGLLCLSLTPACGEDENTLDGSIGEQFSLKFDRVRFRKQGSDLIIEYLKSVSTSVDPTKVCKIVVEGTDLGLGSGDRLTGDTFRERVTILRVASTGGDFPEVKSGAIEFETLKFKNKGDIQGKFEAVFKDSGRTLSGTFKGTIQEIVL